MWEKQDQTSDKKLFWKPARSIEREWRLSFRQLAHTASLDFASS